MHLLLLAVALVTIAPVQKDLPNRQPQVAANAETAAVVFGSGTSIWFASSEDGGKSFETPVEVTKLPMLALGRHRGPRVTFAGKTILVTAIMGGGMQHQSDKEPSPGFGDLAAWRSGDGGKSWSKPVAINDVAQAAHEGLHAITAGPDGELAAVWLDLRQKGTHLYGSYSRDGGETWSKNVLLYESPDGTICQCCDPSVTWTGPRRFEVMFRNFIQGCRDMYVASWRTGSGVDAARKAGDGAWTLNACPMDGGGIARVNNRTLTAWRREETVYLDEIGKPEIALGRGKDVAIAGTREGAWVAWTGASGIMLHEPDSDAPRVLSPTGKFPVLTALPNGDVLAAFEDGEQIAIEVVDHRKLSAERR